LNKAMSSVGDAFFGYSCHARARARGRANRLLLFRRLVTSMVIVEFSDE
jgi:hypothetical protein